MENGGDGMNREEEEMEGDGGGGTRNRGKNVIPVFCVILSHSVSVFFGYCSLCVSVFSLCVLLWLGGIYRDEIDSFEVEEDGFVDKKL